MTVGNIDAFWFSPHPTTIAYNNWGDIVAPVIIEALSGARARYKKHGGSRYLTVGSVLSLLQAGDIVWGSGLIDPLQTPKHMKGVTIHAVRGPLTRRHLLKNGFNVPEVYGDPAIFLPDIYKPIQKEEVSEIGVIPHYVDKEIFKRISKNVGLTYININSGVTEVMDAVASCRVILSSSLHGIILAESLGKPTAFIIMSNKLIGRTFKFDDYYLSSGREPVRSIIWDCPLRETDLMKAKEIALSMPRPEYQKKMLLEACPFYKLKGIRRMSKREISLLTKR